MEEVYIIFDPQDMAALQAGSISGEAVMGDVRVFWNIADAKACAEINGCWFARGCIEGGPSDAARSGA